MSHDRFSCEPVTRREIASGARPSAITRHLTDQRRHLGHNSRAGRTPSAFGCPGVRMIPSYLPICVYSSSHIPAYRYIHKCAICTLLPCDNVLSVPAKIMHNKVRAAITANLITGQKLWSKIKPYIYCTLHVSAWK